MAEYSKPSDLNVRWASSATGGDITDPGDTKVNTGNTVEKPAYNYFNWWMNRVDTFNAFMNQHGYPTWDADTEYQAEKSYVMHSNGTIYRCIQTHTNQAIPNATYWEIAFGDYGTSYTKAESDAKYLQISLNGSDISNIGTFRTNLSVYSVAQVDTAISTSTNRWLIVRDEKSLGTSGGSSVAGTQTRTLNTVHYNSISGASLSSNTITLPAGTYHIFAKVPAFGTDNHQATLYNTGTSTVIASGTSENTIQNSASDPVTTSSVIDVILTFASSTNLTIRHYTERALASYGLGRSVSNSTEVYTTVTVQQIG